MIAASAHKNEVKSAANIGAALSLDPSSAIGGAALDIESLLEIGLGISGPIPFRRALQDVRVGHRLLGRLEIIFVISRETKFSAGSQRGSEIADKIGLHEPTRPMASLRPRIGKHDVRDRNAFPAAG